MLLRGSVPVGFSRNDITFCFGVLGNLVCADGVVRPHRDGAADDHQQGNDEHALAKTRAVRGGTLVHDLAVGVLCEDVPLNGKAIEADHAVEFRAHEEDERVEETVVVGMDTDEVRVKAMRVREHRHQMREHEEEEREGRDQLNVPERRVFMVDKLDVRVQIVELLVGSREAAKCAEHMNDHAQEDEAHKEDVHPGVVSTVKPDAAGGGDQVGEEVLAEIHGAGKAHVAEKEDAEDQTGDGLCHVETGGALALTLGVLEADTPDIVCGRRRMRILDGIRGRHD